MSRGILSVALCCVKGSVTRGALGRGKAARQTAPLEDIKGLQSDGIVLTWIFACRLCGPI